MGKSEEEIKATISDPSKGSIKSESKTIKEVVPCSPDWMHRIIPLPEEKGAKNKCTNSNNFHRHHKELSKVITELKTEIEDLKLFKRMVLSRHTEAYWCRVEKYIKRLIAQEDKIKEEQRKLEVLKKERTDVHYKYRG